MSTADKITCPVRCSPPTVFSYMAQDFWEEGMEWKMTLSHEFDLIRSFFISIPLTSSLLPWDLRRRGPKVRAQGQLDMQNDWNRQKVCWRLSRPDMPACHSASPHKDKARSSTQATVRESPLSETHKSRDVKESGLHHLHMIPLPRNHFRFRSERIDLISAFTLLHTANLPLKKQQ